MTRFRRSGAAVVCHAGAHQSAPGRQLPGAHRRQPRQVGRPSKRIGAGRWGVAGRHAAHRAARRGADADVMWRHVTCLNGASLRSSRLVLREAHAAPPPRCRSALHRATNAMMMADIRMCTQGDGQQRAAPTAAQLACVAGQVLCALAAAYVAKTETETSRRTTLHRIAHDTETSVFAVGFARARVDAQRLRRQQASTARHHAPRCLCTSSCAPARGGSLRTCELRPPHHTASGGKLSCAAGRPSWRARASYARAASSAVA
jgi:hypothetical protein